MILLVAEDERINQLYLSHFLEREGHRVTLVSDGVQALAASETTRFDAILMDGQMPRMDGLEATRRIRSRQSGATPPDVPIIALSAHSMQEDHESFLAAGMSAVMTKPVDEARLLQTLTDLTEGR